MTLHHIKLDDSVQDKYLEIFGKAATKEMLTHLQRELIQSVWTVILDDEFMDTYACGFPFVFQDGIERRVFVTIGLHLFRRYVGLPSFIPFPSHHRSPVRYDLACFVRYDVISSLQ